MSAKADILARIRDALKDVPETERPEDCLVDWVHGRPVDLGDADIVDIFAERVIDYKAAVTFCASEQLPAHILAAAREHDVKSVVVPPGLDKSWLSELISAGIEITVDSPEHQLSNKELNDTGAVITASAVSSAETGTIMLDHKADQGRRALSLVPDVHICVVRRDQIVSSVPECVSRLKDSVVAGQPITWISGPSATSDIELSRVEGVHGPRNLIVFIID